MENKTNWLAIVVAVIACMGIGFLWYGVLFQEAWTAGNGITAEGDKYFKNGVEMPMSNTPMILNTIAMVVYALIMNWLVGRTGVNSWMGGATLGAAIGAIMVINTYIGNVFAGNSSSLSMVDGSYAFVLFTVIGAIVGGWRK